MTYQVPPAPVEPKHDLVDRTDRPDIIAACDTEDLPLDVANKAPMGGWYGGRFLVYRRSLRQWKGEPVETIV